MPTKATESIKVSPEVKAELDEQKRYDREPYYSVIERGLKALKNTKGGENSGKESKSAD